MWETEGKMWLKVALGLVLLQYKVNAYPFVHDEDDQDWSSIETVSAGNNEEEKPSFKRTGPVGHTVTPCPPLQLPESMRIMASDVHLPLFKPDRTNRPLPDVLKSIFLPLPKKSVVSAPKQKDIELLCHLDRIYVRVLRSMFLDPVAGKFLKVGTCAVNQVTAQHYYFLYPLNGCEVQRQETENGVTYVNTLTYEPADTGLVAREMPFSVNLQCHYNKHHRSYSIGFSPHVEGGTVYLTLNSRVSLTPVDASWKPLASWQTYVIGQPMYFVAKIPHGQEGMRAYLSKCYITIFHDPESTPKYTVLDNHGCMVDSKITPQSRFYASDDKMVVKFSLGAFIFKEIISQSPKKKSMFLHCELSLGPNVPTPSTKSCSYKADTEKWSELYGEDSVCACCDASCPAPEPPVSTRMVTSNEWALEDEKPALRSFDPQQVDMDHTEFDLFWDTDDMDNV